MKIPKDVLWKGIIEDCFPDLMAFFYPEVLPLLDLDEFEFLDKELQQLFPESDDSRRYADKLVKIRKKDGREQWQLINIEVQGYKDIHFAERMFRYFYRIYDRFGMPIEALALFIDPYKEYHPKVFELSAFQTRLTYKFHTYKLLDHYSKDLSRSFNPFAHILLIALSFLQAGKLNDDHLVELKIQLFRNMLKKGFSKAYIIRLMQFIKHYVHFSKPEMNGIFDKEVNLILPNDTPMGIVESIKEYIYQEGVEKGSINEKRLFTQKLLSSDLFLAGQLSLEKIAELVGISLDEVKQVYAEIS